MSFICTAVGIDFSGGGYKIKSEERKDKEKYERREPKEIADEIERKRLEEKEKNELKRLKSEYDSRLKNNPLKKIVFFEGGIVTNDFVNTTSNRIVISVLDWEKAKADGINDRNLIVKDYRLNLMLLPGDKYHEMQDGGNGVRLAMYLQANKLCQEINDNLFGEKLRHFKKFGTNFSETDDYSLHKVSINLEDEKKELSIVTPSGYDIDGDGVCDIDEVNGTNGFITDPTDPDTDQDGIPDNKDKNPLVACKSDNPNLMPYEWAEYFSEGDNSKVNLLLQAKDDPDGDGLTNEQENILHTNPLVKNTEKIICFPKTQFLKNIGKDYGGIVNVYFNCAFPVLLKIWTSDDRKGYSKETPTIYENGSIPLGCMPSPFKRSFNKRCLNSRPGYFITADVQPKTVYSFKVISNCEKTDDITVDVVAYKRDEYKEGTISGRIAFTDFHLKKIINFSPWDSKEFWPETPNLISPQSNELFSDINSIVFNYADFPEKYKDWLNFKLIFFKLPNYTPCPNHYLYDVDFKNYYRDTSNYNTVSNNYLDYMRPIIHKYSNDKTLLWCFRFLDPYFHRPTIQSETRILFKEDRVNKDYPFVFKASTVKALKEEIVSKGFKDEQLIIWE